MICPVTFRVFFAYVKNRKNFQEDFIYESDNSDDHVGFYGGCRRWFHDRNGDRDTRYDHLENLQKDQIWL